MYKLFDVDGRSPLYSALEDLIPVLGPPGSPPSGCSWAPLRADLLPGITRVRYRREACSLRSQRSRSARSARKSPWRSASLARRWPQSCGGALQISVPRQRPEISLPGNRESSRPIRWLWTSDAATACGLSLTTTASGGQTLVAPRGTR